MNRQTEAPFSSVIKSQAMLIVVLIACLSGCTTENPNEAASLESLASGQAAVSSQAAVSTQAVASETSTDPATPSDSGKATASMPAVGGSMPAMGNMKTPNSADIKFNDDVKTNAEIPKGLDGLVFLDTEGRRVSLDKYIGKKNVVLVFTEGFAGGMLCPFCKTQTSRLVANYDKFANLDTEILVVYPGSRDHLDEFVEAAKKTEKTEVERIPFPLLLDKDLKAVGYFNIASNLAHPSTFIIDKRGNVRLAYVGADMTADRPSVAAMLKILEATPK